MKGTTAPPGPAAAAAPLHPQAQQRTGWGGAVALSPGASGPSEHGLPSRAYSYRKGSGAVPTASTTASPTASGPPSDEERALLALLEHKLRQLLHRGVAPPGAGTEAGGNSAAEEEGRGQKRPRLVPDEAAPSPPPPPAVRRPSAKPVTAALAQPVQYYSFTEIPESWTIYLDLSKLGLRGQRCSLTTSQVYPVNEGMRFQLPPSASVERTMPRAYFNIFKQFRLVPSFV